MTTPPRAPQPVSFRLPPDEVEALRRESEGSGVSQTRIVRDALRERRARRVVVEDDPVALAARIAADSARLQELLAREE